MTTPTTPATTARLAAAALTICAPDPSELEALMLIVATNDTDALMGWIFDHHELPSDDNVIDAIRCF